MTDKLRDGHTSRGFAITEFTDHNGVECSLQKSSIATADLVWLGCSGDNAKHLVRGEGWRPYPLPSDVSVTTRMHLTREQVAELLPSLQHFVETGDIAPDGAALDAAPEADAEPRETEGDALDAAAAMFYGPMTNGTIADELLAWRTAGVAAGERTAPEADAAVELKEAARALDVANKEFMCDGHLGTAQVPGHAWVKFRDALYRPLPPPTRRSPEEIAREVAAAADIGGEFTVAQHNAVYAEALRAIRADRGE